MVSGLTIIDYLVADHVRLHSLLERAMALPDFELEAYTAFRSGLLRHIKIEEKVLFPAVRNAREGLALERAHELRVDHAALTSLLVPTPDSSLCREILWLLSTHDAKEEGAGGIYEECERWLNDEELVLLAQHATSLPEVRMARHFDGPNVYRTAASALAAARRLPAPNDQR